MPQIKIIILGSQGMFGHQLVNTCIGMYETIALDKQNCDITHKDDIEQAIAKYQPDYIINCSAYTAVDLCESEGKMINLQVNALATHHIAQLCQKHHIKLIHISTDYVFGGDQVNGYSPQDPCNPINMYGMAKYLGEQYIIANCTDKLYTIIRTSRLYGGGPQYRNFVNTIIRLTQSKDKIQVINEQYGAPTSTQTLVNYVIQCVEDHTTLGSILHCTDQVQDGGITWYDFAQEIVGLLKTKTLCQITGCATDMYPLPAARPRHSYLINSYIGAQDWKQNLKQYIDTYFNI